MNLNRHMVGKDYYTENPEALDGQPKRSVADYVASQGILVPRRFASLSEARKSKKAIILRSEHPQDYNGCSGMVDSPRLFWYKGKKLYQIKRDILKEPRIGTSMPKQYCRFLGLDFDKFKQETSFSCWERLRGHNRTVIADSAISGRYHIMTFYNEEDKHLYNYTIVENGKISQEFKMPLTPELKEGLKGLITLYETIKNLPRFNKHNCPIMEIQTVGKRDYFLQYHGTRDFKPAEFSLERAPQRDEIEVPFVRGATPQEGMFCKTTLYYAGTYDGDFDIQKEEDGSFDTHWNKVFSELMVRKRKLQMIALAADKTLEFRLFGFVVKHCYISKLFKPEISIIHDHEKILGGEKSRDQCVAKPGKQDKINI